jgi:hypothetical protein
MRGLGDVVFCCDKIALHTFVLSQGVPQNSFYRHLFRVNLQYAFIFSSIFYGNNSSD